MIGRKQRKKQDSRETSNARCNCSPTLWLMPSLSQSRDQHLPGSSPSSLCVWNVSLVSPGQLSWLCPLLPSCASPHWHSKGNWESLTQGQHCATTTKTSVCCQRYSPKQPCTNCWEENQLHPSWNCNSSTRNSVALDRFTFIPLNFVSYSFKIPSPAKCWSYNKNWRENYWK